MKLFNFYQDKELHLGVTDGERFVDVNRCGYPVTMMDVIEDRSGLHRENVARILKNGKPLTQVAHFAPPIVAPEKVLCVGLNYAEHTAETHLEKPAYPALFSKFNNALNAHNHPIILPDTASHYDYEAELVIVIGHAARKVSPEDAPKYIFGYTAGNDFSARDLQLRTTQWLLGKTPDGFAPIGPCITTADELDPSALQIRSYVNGELRQDGNTRDMIFNCAAIVSYISQFFTLKPGDLIFTGTPKGVIMVYPEDKQHWLKAGDTVTVEIEGIGSLTTPLRD